MGQTAIGSEVVVIARSNAEEIRHHLDIGVAGMVQAGQAETCLK